MPMATIYAQWLLLGQDQGSDANPKSPTLWSFYRLEHMIEPEENDYNFLRSSVRFANNKANLLLIY